MAAVTARKSFRSFLKDPPEIACLSLMRRQRDALTMASVSSDTCSAADNTCRRRHWRAVHHAFLSRSQSAPPFARSQMLNARGPPDECPTCKANDASAKLAKQRFANIPLMRHKIKQKKLNDSKFSHLRTFAYILGLLTIAWLFAKFVKSPRRGVINEFAFEIPARPEEISEAF